MTRGRERSAEENLLKSKLPDFCNRKPEQRRGDVRKGGGVVGEGWGDRSPSHTSATDSLHFCRSKRVKTSTFLNFPCRSCSLQQGAEVGRRHRWWFFLLLGGERVTGGDGSLVHQRSSELTWGVGDTRSGLTSFTSCSGGVINSCIGGVGARTDGSPSNAAYLITLMNFLITSTPPRRM